MRALTRLVALVAVASSLGGDLSAQGIAPGSLPIELTVKPAMLLPGLKLTISGTLPGYSANGSVAITVTPPQAPAISLTATATSGKFSAEFTQTTRIGRYAVRAVAPDGKGVAVDSFSVVGGAMAAGAQQTNVARTFELVVTSLTTARTAALATPPSPPQQQLLLKLAEVQKQFAEAPAAAVETYGEALRTIVDVVQQYPDAAPVVQQLLDELAPMTEELNDRLPAIEKLIDGSAKLAQYCDNMAMVEEAFTALTWAMGVTGKLASTLINWANSKGTPAAVKAASGGEMSPAAEAAIASASKAAIKVYTSGKLNWAKTAMAAYKDLLQYLSSEVFDVYCEQFEGPMTAKLVVTFNHNGRPYLKYSISLAGKLVANFAKEAGVTRIPIKGHIEGNATHFGLSENFDVLSDMVEAKTGMGRMSVMRFMPQPAPYVEALGMVARMAMPAYFNIPVSGDLVGDKLTLRLEPAAIDFTPALNKGKLVMIWTLKLPPFIHVETATLPLQNAHFILARGIVEPAPQFPITVDMGAKRSVISRRFTRDHKDPAKGIRVQFDVNIKACNPSCQ